MAERVAEASKPAILDRRVGAGATVAVAGRDADGNDVSSAVQPVSDSKTVEE